MDKASSIKKRKAFCWNCGTEVIQQDYTNIEFIPKCCNCGVPYPEKPKLEAELAIYQRDYLQDRSQKNLDRLFAPLYDMIFNIICTKLKSFGIGMGREKIEDMVQWSLYKLISYYKTKPDFKIIGSFTGYIEQLVLFPIYNKKDRLREDSEISLYTEVNKTSSSSKDKTCTLLDKLSEEEVNETFEADILNRVSQDEVIDNATNFLKQIFNVLYTHHINKQNPKAFTKTMELVFMYKHFIYKKEERYYRELNKTCSPDLKENFDNSLKIFKSYLSTGVVADE